MVLPGLNTKKMIMMEMTLMIMQWNEERKLEWIFGGVKSCCIPNHHLHLDAMSEILYQNISFPAPPSSSFKKGCIFFSLLPLIWRRGDDSIFNISLPDEQYHQAEHGTTSVLKKLAKILLLFLLTGTSSHASDDDRDADVSS